jgi:hypothetical protein
MSKLSALLPKITHNEEATEPEGGRESFSRSRAARLVGSAS